MSISINIINIIFIVIMNNQKLRLLTNQKKVNNKKIIKKYLNIIQDLINSIILDINLDKKDPEFWDNQEKNHFFSKLANSMNMSIEDQLDFKFNYPLTYQKYIDNQPKKVEESNSIVVRREEFNLPNIILQTIYYYKEIYIKSDGNCFFRCIDYLLNKTNHDLGYGQIRYMISELINQWIESEDLIVTNYGLVKKKEYILNEFYDGIINDLSNYGVNGYQNKYFDKLDLNEKINFIKFWSEIIKLGESDQSRKLLFDNLMVKQYSENTICYFFNSFNQRNPNLIVASIFWGTNDLLFILSQSLQVNFTILFKNYNYLTQKFEWTHKSYIYLEDAKKNYLKFTGSHYNVLILEKPVETIIINKKDIQNLQKIDI